MPSRLPTISAHPDCTGVSMLGWLDIILRLGAAVLIGAILGLNRELHHKSTGIRTLGLVALGSAIAVLAVAKDPAADASRVIQGVITGIGFLGAGVILHGPTGIQVQGLTTAATIWTAATIGVLCGLGAWQILAVAVVLTVVLLVVGGPLEKWLVRRFDSHQSSGTEPR
jgi:putative Mg2+ transporter-C (MgtC) family protein